MELSRFQWRNNNFAFLQHPSKDSDPTLEPIAIRDIYVKHSNGTYVCDGRRIQFNGHGYDKRVAQYMPPAEPVLTQKGTIAARQPKFAKMELAWWQAQCAFRGLTTKGTIAQLQSNLRGHEQNPIPQDILDFEERSKKEFRVKNEEAREDKWLHKMSSDEKAAQNPRRYLEEIFPAKGNSKEVVVLKAEYSQYLEDLAEELGLQADSTALPPDKGRQWNPPWIKHCVVVGQHKGAVAEKIRSIKREAKRLKSEQQEEEQELKRKNKDLKNKKKKEQEETLAKCKDWDVTGKWKISCPHIEKGWDAEDLMLEIYLNETEKGPQMFAEFDFGAIKGVFRFERQDDDEKGNVSEDDESNLEKDSEEEDQDEEDDDDERSPTPEAFYLGSTTQPSVKYPTWNYRYRGEEQGEGVIELGSDDDLYSLTFCGPKGRTLKGNFGGSAFGDCTFTGVKVGISGSASIDIAEEWASRNYAAYEEARTGRWH
jgi:hypothetical protein